MNCLDFRRHLAIDPATRDSVFLAHQETCARCAEAGERAQGFELQLASALNIALPEGLADRILLRQTTETRHAARFDRRPAWWRMAAMLLLAIGAAGGAYRTLHREAIADLAVAHLPHETFALSSRADILPDEVRAMFAAVGTPLAGAPGQVNYLHRCPVGRDTTVHMVVQRDEGPVTLIYFAKHVERERQSFERNNVVGRQVPMGDGTLILLASQDRSFDLLESTWRSAIVGSTSDSIGSI